MQPWLKARDGAAEQVALGRVVHVDVVLVGEAELDDAQHVRRARAAAMKSKLRMSTLAQLTESGSTGRPPRLTRRPWPSSTEEAPAPKKNQPPPALAQLRRQLLVLMPGGTPHEGWKMMNCMSAEKIGVGELGLADDDLLGQHRLALS